MKETKDLQPLSFHCWSWAKRWLQFFFFFSRCPYILLDWFFISFIGTFYSRSCCTIPFSSEGSKINKASSSSWQVCMLCEYELALLWVIKLKNSIHGLNIQHTGCSLSSKEHCLLVKINLLQTCIFPHLPLSTTVAMRLEIPKYRQ